MYVYYRKRCTADGCLKHPWLQQLRSSTATMESDITSGSLAAAKQNLSTQKEHWEEQGGVHDYVFDRPSKTISIAGAPSPSPQPQPQPPSAKASPEKEVIKFKTTPPSPPQNPSSPAGTPGPNNQHVADEVTPTPSSSHLAPSAAADPLRPSSPTPGMNT